MAVITIDGVRVETADNANVLEAALAAGIYIPHLCHHPDLPENGSCRMCIVEVEGQEGVTLAPDPDDVAGFDAFAKRYVKGLPIVRQAVTDMD